jgi:hypothetical protein
VPGGPIRHFERLVPQSGHAQLELAKVPLPG